MQRISRLLSGPPSHVPWRVPAGLIVLLFTGGLIATGTDVSKHTLLNPGIESSTDSALAPAYFREMTFGGFREITTDGLGKQRSYRIGMGPLGRITAIYKEGPQNRANDGKVPAWQNDVTTLSPQPPAPYAPALPPMPATALPSLPSAPPSIADSNAFKNLLSTVAADKRLVATLGSPAHVAPDSIDGSLNLSDTGDANLSFVMTGPKGHAKVRVSSKRYAGFWQVSFLDVGSVAR